MTTIPLQFTNQFGQTVIPGTLDLDLMSKMSLPGILSPNQVSPATVVGGAPVAIDTTITSGFVINFLSAAQNAVAIGYLKVLAKQGVFSPLDPVEVALAPAPIMWLVAASTITPGQTVETATGDARGVQPQSANKARGIALDYAVANQALRVYLTQPWSIAS